MPIKFRCSYCRQFLGISRNRVGGIVDCPTCGRSIRVPGLDGVAEPLPGPELDRDDSHLARALDELAALVDAPLLRAVTLPSEVDHEETEIPQPLPEPEPVELPMPVRLTPVAVMEPITNGVVSSSAAESRAALDELLQPVQVSHVVEQPNHRAEFRSPASGVLFVVLIPIIALVLGLAIGWWGRGQTLSLTPTVPQQPVPVEAPVVTPSGGVEGRITYRTASGETLPDAGALVIAIPETWSGQLRLSPIGLRPGDAEADQSAALLMAGSFGGGAVRTDQAGRYHLPLPQPGRYTVMIMSRFAERVAESSASPAKLTELSPFLSDPAATIGNRAVHAETITSSADQTTAADHVF